MITDSPAKPVPAKPILPDSVVTRPVLEVRDITVRFAGFCAVNKVTFTLERGSIGGLIGPNGAGKTTLFNTMAGLVRSDAGDVILDGQSIGQLSPHRVFSAGLARTFQIPRPFPQMTVLENVMTVPSRQTGEKFWNNWFRAGRVAIQERQLRDSAQDIISFCNLAGVAGQLANTLSGGQLKLLELARVLMAEPRIILLDEPAAGVNPSLMVTLVDKIKELNKRGYSFLIIEHNMDVVMSICSQVMVMAQGSLIYNGEAEGARADPRVLDAYLGDLP